MQRLSIYSLSFSETLTFLRQHNRIYDGRYIRVQLRDCAVQKIYGPKSSFRSSEGRPFSPRHQTNSKVEGLLVDDSPLRVQDGVRSAPAPCEEITAAFSHSPNRTASSRLDVSRLPENSCVPGVPLQAPSTMVSSIPVPAMTYPPPPQTTFYAPAPWYMHPYQYAPTPHIFPRYPQMPLASPVVTTGTNEAGRHILPHSIYQVRALVRQSPI